MEGKNSWKEAWFSEEKNHLSPSHKSDFTIIYSTKLKYELLGHPNFDLLSLQKLDTICSWKA